MPPRLFNVGRTALFSALHLFKRIHQEFNFLTIGSSCLPCVRNCGLGYRSLVRDHLGTFNA
jgi:hypothetical protein